MKPFNLEEYLKNPSKKLVTKGGKTVKRILCTDARGNYPIVALIDGGSYDNALSYTKEGKFYNRDTETSVNDLFFAPEKHEGYACIHFNDGIYYLEDTIYSSKEEADNNAKKWDDSIAVTKIEWEE